MTLTKTNKILLTLLYGIGLILFTTLIFEGTRWQVLEDIITYLFYLFSVIAILKGFMDVITKKRISDLIYLGLASAPMIVLLFYLVLSETYGG